ncbi:Heparan-alpha-glucosaminide N-acetyltransferase [Camellia lanceoleosa]|uniref:Heparan-alpha-glucosaminide N-acetyltransferase n=1 Tax=Camellia lanceoleosa TaxID=1840588 RepID=A0ACC0ITC9_9ERIC|nr:Heparan-alpha-glucosaminide N-acetyltransferase [Camellia lanceoleosa]
MGEQEYESLSNNEADEEQPEDVVPVADAKTRASKTTRVASLDVFRGLCVFLMMLVDYGGSIFPIIAHSPWNGVHLADLVMPFFLFIAGVSLALGYKRVSDRVDATQKALLRALKLFFLGVLLQGGYLHGITSLTYGVGIERIRWMGILQVFFMLSAFSFYCLCIACALLVVYLGLSYGLYVPDWQFELLSSTSMPPKNGSFVYTVTCSTRGDHGPACNAAGMIDRYVLGLNHLYTKPVYRNLKECNISSSGQLSDNSPSWCHAPFDPEGILSSLTAAVTCIIGLQYGHILGQLQDHKERLYNWCIFSFSFLGIGLFLALVGIPLNKPLYTISYMLVTSASAGITFSALYILVDIHGHRHLTCALEWIGKHALSIFVLISSNLAVIAIQGFYWNAPENNIIHWVVTRVRQS